MEMAFISFISPMFTDFAWTEYRVNIWVQRWVKYSFYLLETHRVSHGDSEMKSNSKIQHKQPREGWVSKYCEYPKPIEVANYRKWGFNCLIYPLPKKAFKSVHILSRNTWHILTYWSLHIKDFKISKNVKCWNPGQC